MPSFLQPCQNARLDPFPVTIFCHIWRNAKILDSAGLIGFFYKGFPCYRILINLYFSAFPLGLPGW